jgi:hypothetical protein
MSGSTQFVFESLVSTAPAVADDELGGASGA